MKIVIPAETRAGEKRVAMMPSGEGFALGSVEGRVAISLGTSGTIFARTAAAARDPTGAVCPFLDATGGGLPLLCTLNCAAVPEEARAAYGLERDAIVALPEVAPKTECVCAGCGHNSIPSSSTSTGTRYNK